MVNIFHHIDKIAYIFGGLLVVMYAVSAFNEPEYRCSDEDEAQSYIRKARPGLPKYMAERYRYRMFCTVFVLFALAEYLLLANLIPVIPGVDKIVQAADNENLLRAANAILSALLLLGLVQYLRWPRELLFGFVKRWFQGSAMSPG